MSREFNVKAFSGLLWMFQNVFSGKAVVLKFKEFHDDQKIT